MNKEDVQYHLRNKTDKLVTYAPLVSSLLYLLFLTGSIIHQPTIYLSGYMILVHGFVLWAVSFSKSHGVVGRRRVLAFSLEDITLDSYPLSVLVFVWFVHSAMFRSSEVLLDGSVSDFIGIVQSILAVSLIYPRTTATIPRTLVVSTISFVLFALPVHDCNVFHVDMDRVYFRLAYVFVLYWSFAIASMQELEQLHHKDLGGGGGGGSGGGNNDDINKDRDTETVIRDRHMGFGSIAWHFSFRDVVRSAWPLFIIENGMVVATFVIIVYSGVGVITKLSCIVQYVISGSVESTEV